MEWTLEELKETFSPLTPDGDEFILCSQLYRKLESTLNALRNIAETLKTTPSTSESLNEIENSLHWLRDYCDTFFEKVAFQDKAQREKCYETVKGLIEQIKAIMSTFETAESFRLALPDATLCYGNLEKCVVLRDELKKSLEEYPDGEIHA
ncbi:unnamed protein product [Clonostachys rosea f. rosea IK726]|jgi:hypothetical protein|uniref:Uncharacterized protein n=2 Tax=Bionectria ochroleuca TaxID=29856 RepID=A0A8H7NM10_BIOOC|nr:unnamed protein product [Clonostachys rosea f. rosea IK726]